MFVTGAKILRPPGTISSSQGSQEENESTLLYSRCIQDDTQESKTQTQKGKTQPNGHSEVGSGEPVETAYKRKQDFDERFKDLKRQKLGKYSKVKELEWPQHFAHYLSLVVRKLVFGVSDQSDTNQAVQLLNMARGLKFWIQKVEGLYYQCCENKGADQLRSYCAADLRLCFRIYKSPVFSRCGSFISQWEPSFTLETRIMI